MNPHETCPFCGAGVDCKSERWMTSACFTMIENGINARQYQTATCKDSERLQLVARIAALRAAGDALARHVAEDTRGQTARRLVEAWEEAAR